jgi:hypothetical protein
MTVPRESFVLKKLSSRFVEIAVWTVLSIAVYGFFLSLSLPRITEPADWDEPQWILVSQIYFYLAYHGDFSNQLWNYNFGTYGRNNPKIAQYFIGAPIFFSGNVDLGFKTAKWDWYKSFAENERAGLTPRFLTLFYGRLLIPFLGAACALLFFLLMARSMHWIPALAAAIFLGSHPLFVSYSAKALQDVPTLFFCMLFLSVMSLLDWRKAMAGSWLKALTYSVIAGFLLGLAIGTKMNNLALLMVFAIFLGWLCLDLAEGRPRLLVRQSAKALFLGALALLVCAKTAIQSNPYLYADSLQATMEKSRALFELSSIVRSYPAIALKSYASKIKAINRNLCPKRSLAPLAGAVMVFGFVCFLCRFRKALKQNQVGEADRLTWLGLAGLIIFAANFFWLPFDWARFFIPFLLPAAILIGFAAEGLVKFGIRNRG